MYGYPEQFIPAPELIGYGAPANAASRLGPPAPEPKPSEVPAR